MNIDDALDSADQAAATPPHPKAPPIESRFLFVDVAAMRAKQLRRGALPRLGDEPSAVHKVEMHKPERIAMEEVRRGLVSYDLPTPKDGDAG